MKQLTLQFELLALLAVIMSFSAYSGDRNSRVVSGSNVQTGKIERMGSSDVRSFDDEFHLNI